MNKTMGRIQTEPVRTCLLVNVNGEAFPVRMAKIPVAARYCGMGITRARQWFGEIGAVRKAGSAIMIDMTVVNEALDACENGVLYDEDQAAQWHKPKRA